MLIQKINSERIPSCLAQDHQRYLTFGKFSAGCREELQFLVGCRQPYVNCPQSLSREAALVQSKQSPAQ